MFTESRRASAQVSSRVRAQSKSASLLTSTALIPVAAALALMPSQAFAETVVWDGETSTDPATATNWNIDMLPSGTGVVVIDSSAVPSQPRVVSAVTWGETNISAGVLSLADRLTSNITISDTGTVDVEFGGNVTGNIDVQSGGTLIVRDLLAASASITLNGTGQNGTGQNGTGALRGLGQVPLLFAGVTLASDSRIESDVGLSIFSTVSGTGQTLTFGGSGTTVIQSGSIRTGTGSVIKEGGGFLGLFGANTYTGDTHIKQGGLQFGFGSALSDTGLLILDAGTSAALVAGSETIGGLSGSGTLFIQTSGNLTIGSALDSTFSGSIQVAGTGGIAKQGTGTLTLTGNNSYTGQTTVSGGTLKIGSANALGSAAAGTIVSSGGTLLIVGSSPNLAITEALTITGTGVNGGGAIRIEPDATSGNQGVNLFGGVTLAGDATITVTDRIFLGISSGDIGIGTSTLTFKAEETGNSTTTVSSRITGTGGVTKTGSGLLNLAGTNSFTGPLTINGGDLNLVFGAALADTVAVSMSAGARLFVTNSETIGSLAGTGTVNIGTGAVFTTGGNNTSTTFAGVIGGAGALAKTGTGTFALTGTSNYGGATTISDGTLQIGDGGTTGSITSTSIVNNSILEFNRSDNISYNGVISGSGSVIKRGAGFLTLFQANTYDGATTITAPAWARRPSTAGS
ncbi:autotransporter-associated beta strand repeat-containing protein [Porphyrobacter sp. AAP82]|uniref:autotransporter-associated beta strand repeat-containing protein n=1 Tax=Porphyrobacter sp. AAP82 TaxID=1248917 RepID=UPI0003818977|nr:autotransporter-associated beta strand repeat-containing protein [Porphyrobacter sp. AAP82]